MEAVISLLILSTLPQLVVPQVASVRAVAELVSQDSRIFSGESVRLKCSEPSGYKSSWRFLWFKETEQLPQTGEYLVLWNTKDRDSGKYYCQGVRDSMIGEIQTLPSLPVEIIVDGGWAILKVPPYPSLSGHTLSLTCMVRGEPQLQELILYKDGLEIMRQRGLHPTFHLPNLTLQDTGMYSCRASWDVHRRTRSVISAEVQVQVLEVLSQPVLEIDAENNGIPGSKMKLICHLQYNAPAPAPPLHYYFYKGDDKLATAMSENHLKVTRTPGNYRCRAKVPELDLVRWSEPQTFEPVTGPKTMMPSILHPRDPWPLVPPNSGPISSPDSSLPPVAESSTAEPLRTSTVLQPTDVSTESSNPLLGHSQSTQENLSSTVLPIKVPVNIFEEWGEMSGESGDKAEGSGSGDMPEGFGDMDDESRGDMVDESGSGDMPEGFGYMDDESGSGDIAKGSGDMPEGFGDMDDESRGDMVDESGSGDMPEGFGYMDHESGSGDIAKGSGDMPEGFGDIDDESRGDMVDESGSGDMPKGFGYMDDESGSGDIAKGSGDTFDWSGDSGDMPEGSGDMAQGSGDMSEGSGDMAEGSGEMPEGSGDMVEGSGEMAEGSEDMSEGFWDMAEGSGDMPEGSGDMAEGSGEMPEGSGDMAQGSGDMAEGFLDMAEGSGEMLEGSGDMSEGFWDMAEGSGDMREGSGEMLDGSGDMPEGSGDMAEGSGEMPEGS